MIIEYVQAALRKAKYEIIDDPEPYYGEIPRLRGVGPQAIPLRNVARIS